MNPSEWKDVILALLAALPGTIAAVSSIRNGRSIHERADQIVRQSNEHARRQYRE